MPTFLPGEQDAPGTGYNLTDPSAGKSLKIPGSPVTHPINIDDIPGKVWQIANDAISADGRLVEGRTITRAAFAVGQVARLALGIANGSIEARSGGTYDMPDYEAEHGQIPRSRPGGGGGGTTPPSPAPAPGGGPPPQGGSIPDNAHSIALAIRAKYPSWLGEFTPLRLTFLRDLAKALGPDAGLLEKTTGTNNNGFSVDIICFKNGDHFDVVNGATTQAQWSYVGKVDPSRWRAP